MFTKNLTAIALCLFAGVAFAVTFVPLAGELSVITSSNRRTAEVTVSNAGVVTAQFCLSFPRPLEQPINLSDRGHVIYLPLEAMPPGTRMQGSEPIAQTLTVVPEGSPPLGFVAKGVMPIDKNAKTIVIQSVTLNATGREPGTEGCFSTGS